MQRVSRWSEWQGRNMNNHKQPRWTLSTPTVGRFQDRTFDCGGFSHHLLMLPNPQARLDNEGNPISWLANGVTDNCAARLRELIA